jgi:hypothetical protein
VRVIFLFSSSYGMAGVWSVVWRRTIESNAQWYDVVECGMVWRGMVWCGYVMVYVCDDI